MHEWKERKNRTEQNETNKQRQRKMNTLDWMNNTLIVGFYILTHSFIHSSHWWHFFIWNSQFLFTLCPIKVFLESDNLCVWESPSILYFFLNFTFEIGIAWKRHEKQTKHWIHYSRTWWITNGKKKSSTSLGSTLDWEMYSVGCLEFARTVYAVVSNSFNS